MQQNLGRWWARELEGNKQSHFAQATKPQYHKSNITILHNIKQYHNITYFHTISQYHISKVGRQKTITFCTSNQTAISQYRNIAHNWKILQLHIVCDYVLRGCEVDMYLVLCNVLDYTWLYLISFRTAAYFMVLGCHYLRGRFKLAKVLSVSLFKLSSVDVAQSRLQCRWWRMESEMESKPLKSAPILAFWWGGCFCRKSGIFKSFQ